MCNVGSLFNVEDACPHDQNKKKFPTREYPVKPTNVEDSYPHDQSKKKFPTREYPVSKPSAVEYVIPAIRP